MHSLAVIVRMMSQMLSSSYVNEGEVE